MQIIVFGASGYVGGRLIPSLLDQGHSVRALTRHAGSLSDYPWATEVEVVEADLMKRETLLTALRGADAVYYLVHSMGSEDFEKIDRTAATNFAETVPSSVRRVIYLGGLGKGNLSPHLESRQEVGRILTRGNAPVIELRAAVIIGSGSLSFEMTRYLSEVLPVMVTPRWVDTMCQPIAIRDVITYLMKALDLAKPSDMVVEVGGADVLSYADMLQSYATEAGLRPRLIINVPVLSLGLSARWVGLVTPLSNAVASHLVQSLRHEVIVTDDSADRFGDVKPVGYREAVRRAIERTRGDNVPTRWARGGWHPASPLPSDPDHAFGTILTDSREIESDVAPEFIYQTFMAVGGAQGYYTASWAWRTRGLLDQLFGGIGLRRGRRHPRDLRVGETLDFWRVVGIEPGRSLELKAEMLMPGQAWLRWEVESTGSDSFLYQTASFSPRGLFGRFYWYVLYPFHGFIFPRMAKGIVASAERLAASAADDQTPADTI